MKFTLNGEPRQSVVFLEGYKGYAPGDIAGFDPKYAQGLIDHDPQIAEDHKEPPDGDEQALRRRRIADVPKVRPRK